MAAGPAVDAPSDEEAIDVEGEAAAAPKGKFGGKKRLVVLAAAPLLLAAIGAGVFFSGILGGGHEGGETAAAHEESAEAEHGPGVYVDLPEILVNLEAIGRQPRFLKTSISVEVANAKEAEELKKMMPRLIDQFQTYLRGLRVDDLRGSAGVYRLRQELLARVAQASQPVDVSDVLFRELLVQ